MGTSNRQVALKELRPERSADATLLSRFLEEAKVTGQLEHPGIVPVYELARRSSDGKPFYTMRFIRGRTLAEAAREYHRKLQAAEAGPLDLATLLNALVGVCNAVAYAHSRGVIHRDLKPQNVVLGDFGEVIVLDWGLAKLVDRPEKATPFSSVALGEVEGHSATMPGQVLGTPSYMSPEQAEGATVNQASDVYGLGAVLYEILTGRPPFESSETRELLRRVVIEAPARPRDVVSTTPRALESVCLKALAKSPSDRFGSATELADEIRRFLADEPVQSFREPLAARVGRWMRRHRMLVNSVAVLLITVLAAATVGLVLLGRKNREIADQRTAALIAAQEVEAVNAFLTDDLLGQADPDANARDKRVTVEELLRRAAATIDGNAKLAGRPEVEATLRLTLGKTFFKLSDLTEAEKHLRQAVDLRRKVFGPDDPRALTAQEALADFLNRGPERVTESLPLAHQHLGSTGRVLGPEHRDTLDSMDTYAMSLSISGQLDRAISLWRECLAARRRVLGENHPDTIAAMGNLAFGLGKRGEWPEAISLERRVIDGRRTLSVPDSDARDVSILATHLYIVGDLEEGERLLSEAVDTATLRLGVNHRETDRLRWLQIRFWIDQGQLERAVTVGREELARRRRNYPIAIAWALMDQGRGLVLLGKFDEAEAVLAECLSLVTKSATPLPHYPAWAKCWYGASLRGLRRYDEAEPHLLAAEKILLEAPSCPRRHYRQVVEQLVKLYEAWGKPDQAAPWRKKLEATGNAAQKGSLD